MNQQILFDGLVAGLTIGLVAQGVVLVYRSSRVINFAVGSLGAIAAALVPLAVINYGWPVWAAIAAGLAAGTLTGALVELVVVRRLFQAPRVTLLIATIGISQAAAAGVAALPDVDDVLSAQYPVLISGRWDVGALSVSGAQVAVLLIVPLVAGALSLFLNRTTVGRAVTASADNPSLARTLGISPKAISTLVWAVAGLVAGLAMILLSGLSARVSAVEDLGPLTMVRALAAALIAGFVSFRIAMFAGLAIGVMQSVIRFELVQQPGLVELVLLLVVVAAVWWRSRRQSSTPSESLSFGPGVRAVPERLRSIWWVRHLGLLTAAPVVLAAALVPFVVTRASQQLLLTTVLAFAICAFSLTVLTGWAGQLSLGQMAFAGLGALTAAACTNGVQIGLGGGRTLQFEPLPFGIALILAGVVAALLAALIGFGALRVDGMLLAVTTFALGVSAVAYLYGLGIFGAASGTSVPFTRGSLFGVDLSSERRYYHLVLLVLVVVAAMVARLRRTGPGRVMIAVRDNPDAAAGSTVGTTRTKVSAFALSGAIAGLGGALLAGAIESVPITERFFQVEDSLMIVAIVVIGGLGSTWGPILGSLWVVGLPVLFPENSVMPLFVSGIGLLVLLLYFPGGLARLGYGARDALLRAAERSLPSPDARQPAAVSAPRTPTPPQRRVADGSTPLRAHDITVRFGGNVAVDGVSVHVESDEILGLIGANGAGKSTLLSAIGGFVPASGTVELHGQDVSDWLPHRRAGAGLGRTFQAARLFPELTVRETVLVGLEARHRSSLLATAALLPSAARAERRNRAEAADLIDLVGLGRHADSAVSTLSTGTRRVLELVTLLALDARVLCLDEPTAGVAQRETEALGPLLLRLRRELGAAMVIIEHDMPFLMSITDRVYCLEAGRVIAEGSPAEVRSDPAVIASYLGTDTRAIDRSGAVTTPRKAHHAP